MKAEIIGIIVVVLIFYFLHIFASLEMFWFQVIAVIFIIFGFIPTFALGDTIEGISGGMIGIGIIFLVSGIIMLILSAFI